MPPWMGVRPTNLKCSVCRKSFTAKRQTAKYCSPTCTNKGRKPRRHDPAKATAWRLDRLRRPGYRERINAQANARATALRRWLDAYKLRVGCVGCGYKSHPVALHFDHIHGDKQLNVCNAKSIAQAQREIAKCVVRCANCHAVKTHPRGNCQAPSAGS